MNGIDTTAVIQVAIVVRDLDATVKAWTEFLGIGPSELMVSGTLAEAGTEYRGAATGARCRIAFFDFGQCRLELLEPIDAPSVWSDHLMKRGEGVQHIAFAVRGMGNGIEEFDRLGIRLAQRGDNGRYAYFDSEARLGTMIELLEVGPEDGPVDEDTAGNPI